jgi:hypothetical protein
MGQTPSERTAAVILDEEGFESIDPAHPLGGKDGGADALIQKNGELWVMAVYFPRGQQSISEITDKLTSDVEKAKSKTPTPVGVAFVTNQELRLAEREAHGKVGGDTKVELYHHGTRHNRPRPPTYGRGPRAVSGHPSGTTANPGYRRGNWARAHLSSR